MEFLVELLELCGTRHVDEGLAHIAAIGGINRQLEEVIAAQEVLIDEVKQHGLCVLVGDVLDHEASALV